MVEIGQHGAMLISRSCSRGPAPARRSRPAAGPGRWPALPGRRRSPANTALRLLALVLCGAAFGPGDLPALAADPPAKTRAPRPEDLLILLRIASVNGEKQVGIYGAKADPSPGGLWSVQVWEETNDRVTIATDRISCSAAAPTRLTGSGSQLLVRQLNPGGPIHAGNRLDHLIWWAVCHPALAGRDPAGLASQARQLGYSGQLPELQQQLQAPRR